MKSYEVLLAAYDLCHPYACPVCFRLIARRGFRHGPSAHMCNHHPYPVVWAVTDDGVVVPVVLGENVYEAPLLDVVRRLYACRAASRRVGFPRAKEG